MIKKNKKIKQGYEVNVLVLHKNLSSKSLEIFITLVRACGTYRKRIVA